MEKALLIRTILGIIGNITSGALFISPTPTVYRIIKNKSVEGFHPWPYRAALMNCFMWVFYAMPFVHPHSVLVMTINSLGIALELCYLAVFFYYNNAKTRGKMVGLLLIQLIALAGIVADLLAPSWKPLKLLNCNSKFPERQRQFSIVDDLLCTKRMAD